MALHLVQVEEIQALLRLVPSLVDQLEQRRSEFVDNVHGWLKQVEQVLEQNRLPLVSQIASHRAMLIQATRGLHGKEVVFTGKPTQRKILDATASLVLQRCNHLLHDLIAERLASHQEAERLARQILVVAKAKGILQSCTQAAGQQAFLQCLQDQVSADRDLINLYNHFVAMVGKYDALIFFDRMLSDV